MGKQKVEVVVATNPDRDVLTSEMWLNDELIGEIVPVGQNLHIVLCPRSDGQFHELSLEAFEELLQRAKKEALLNLEAELKNQSQVNRTSTEPVGAAGERTGEEFK
jgi:hypothetical protein